MLDKAKASFPEGSFEAALEMMASEHPMELKLKGVEQLTKMAENERKVFTESNVLSVCRKLSSFDSVSDPQLVLAVLKFIAQVSKYHSTSTSVQKLFLDFLCNETLLNCQPDDDIWFSVATNVHLLLEDIVLPDNYLALSKALVFLSSMLPRTSEKSLCPVKTSMVSAIITYSDFVDNEIFLVCFNSAISHLKEHSSNVERLKESTSMMSALFKCKPSALTLESINEVIFLCQIKDVLQNFSFIGDLLEEMITLSTWGHFVYYSCCEVLKSVASSLRYLPASVLKRIGAFVNKETLEENCHYGPLLEMVLEVLSHVNTPNSDIEKEVLTICDDFICKQKDPNVSAIMVSLHSRALFYDILEALISRQKLKEKADSHVRVHLEKILSEEIEAIKSLKKFESLEALKLLHLMDSSLEVTSFQFKIRWFDYSFKTVSKTLDDQWINRFENHLRLATRKGKHREELQSELLESMRNLLKEPKIMSMYEQEIMMLLLNRLQNCKARSVSPVTFFIFDFCFHFCRLCCRSSVRELLMCLCDMILQETAKDPNSCEFLGICFENVLDLDPNFLEEFSHHVSVGKHFFTVVHIWNKIGHLIHHKQQGHYVVPPQVRSKVLCLLISPGMLRYFELFLVDPSSEHDCQPLESVIVLGLKLVIECLRNETDWDVFSAAIVQLYAFLHQQETVEKIFGNRVLKGIIEGESDDLISLGCTFLEQLVIELCSLVEVKSSTFRKRFNVADNCQLSLVNDQISTYRSLIFQCLMDMVTYQLDVKHRRIVSVFTNGIQDSRCAVTCLSALTVCILEYPLQSCSRLIPSMLDNIFKMKSARSMSVPALNFIFMLSQLPTLHHNFRCEDHKQVMMVILQFVDYSSYSKYCAEVALNLLCLWFLKSKVSYRQQLAQLIVTELRSRLRKLEQLAELHSKSMCSRTESVIDNSENDGHSQQPEILPTKSDPSKSSLRQLATLQEIALNLCQDVVGRNLFSNSSQMSPKRSKLGDLLLSNGLTKTWIYNERIVTITTSGESYKVMSNGLCKNCNDKVNNANQASAPTGRPDRSRHKSTPQTNVKDQRNHFIIKEGIELNTRMGSDASGSQHCACWISGWAEVCIRTATGSTSFLSRTQQQRKANVLSNFDFPLDKMGVLMPNIAGSSAESGDVYSQTSSCSSMDCEEAFEARDYQKWSKPRMSIAVVGFKNKAKLESSLVRSKSLDDVSQLLNNEDKTGSGNEHGKKRKQSSSSSKQQVQSGFVKKRHESGFALGSRIGNISDETKSQISSEMDQSNPAHVFALLFATSASHFVDKNSSASEKLVLLPDTEDAKDDLNYFDNFLPISAHKVGVLYVDEGQACDESAVLSNICGSERYTDFVRGLGSVLCLSDNSADLKLYTGGLDKSSRELDGKFAICWIEELFHVVFHVATLMPTPDASVDPHCRRKKALIGNDAVVVVYNDSKSPLSEHLIETELNFITILVTPTDGQRSSVRVLFKPELEPWVIHASREEKIMSDKNVSVYVRQLALHSSMACHGYLFKQKNLDYTSNWSKRLELIRKMRVKYAKGAEFDPLSDLV